MLRSKHFHIVNPDIWPTLGLEGKIVNRRNIQSTVLDSARYFYFPHTNTGKLRKVHNKVKGFMATVEAVAAPVVGFQ